MGEDMLPTHAVVNKLDEGNQTQMVSCYVHDPPFVLMPEIIQRREHTPHFIRRSECAFSKHPVKIFQGLPMVRVRPCSIVKWTFRNNVHAVLQLTHWQLYSKVANMSTSSTVSTSEIRWGMAMRYCTQPANNSTGPTPVRISASRGNVVVTLVVRVPAGTSDEKPQAAH
jgi:hypothetical protein